MKFLITEEEKNEIRKLHNLQEEVLMEQSWLKKLIGTSADDLVKLFGDDAVKTFETLLSKSLQNSKTFVSRNGMNFLKSASGKEIPMKTIEDAIEAVSQGNIAASDIAKYLPQKLADGSEFRSVFLNSFSKKVQKIEQKTSGQIGAAARNITSFEKNFLLNNCHSAGNCPGIKSILDSFTSKLPKPRRFNPSGVKVLSSENIAGREIIHTQLEDGSKILFYKSSGQNVASTGKQAGEWFVIPGFGDQGWFFKTQETVNLTKGGNQYLTDMAEFLYANGSKGLGK
jgi:hypothetical protein